MDNLETKPEIGYFLSSGICCEIIRHGIHFKNFDIDLAECGLSPLCVFAVCRRIQKAPEASQPDLFQRFNLILSSLEQIPINNETALNAADILQHCSEVGVEMTEVDALAAGHAKALELKFVESSNFRIPVKVDGLEILTVKCSP